VGAHRIAVVGFDHMHAGDQVAVARDHPGAEIVGVHDDGGGVDRARGVLESCGVDAPVFDDLDRLLDTADPEIAFVCSTTARHRELAVRLARSGVHVILEKPFADSDEAVAAMVDAATAAATILAVNWPLAWVPSHRTAQRLAAAGAIGDVQQVHFYDGNRGPLYHSHGKVELDPSAAEKDRSWWYDPAAGGGSLRDYLGYGTTLGTWFLGGAMPRAVTASRHVPDGLRVDEQAVVVGHYPTGLSVFETRWGTFTDPWTQQPSPHCGFVLNGSAGSITSWDYAETITPALRRARRAARRREPEPADRSALANLIAHLDDGRPLDAPLTAQTSQAAHRIVEAAVRSAATNRTVPL